YLIETLRGAVILIPAAVGASFLPARFFWYIFPLTEALTFVIYLFLRNVKKYKIESIARDRVFDGTIFGNADDITRTSQEASEFCEKWEINPKQQYLVTMAIEEIGMSIVTHGMKDMDRGFLQITLIVREDGDVEIHLRDNAVTFDPFSLETSKAGEDGDFDMDAMGVLVIKNKAKDFHYRHYPGFNSISIVI
nr:ATP-binding protein [Lachnospiraceae bacterium]